MCSDRALLTVKLVSSCLVFILCGGLGSSGMKVFRLSQISFEYRLEWLLLPTKWHLDRTYICTIKVNVDGSFSLASMDSGIAGVLKDH